MSVSAPTFVRLPARCLTALRLLQAIRRLRIRAGVLGLAGLVGLVALAGVAGPAGATDGISATAAAPTAEKTAAIPFTPEEQAYIAQAGTILMCVDPDWVPFERINPEGRHEGIAADLVQLVAQRVGLKIALYPVKTWDESLAASKAGRCQIMSFLNQTPVRDKWLNFTAPIFSDPNVIITREEHPFVAAPENLRDESVALPRGTMVAERIRQDYPSLKLILTDSEDQSVSLVSSRQADMTIRSLIVAAYAIKKEGLFNLKIAGQVPHLTNQLRIGVLKSEPLLRDILDKGVRTLTPQERDAISNKHVAIQVQKGVDYSLIWKISLGAALLLLLALYWNRKLTALNRELGSLNRELARLSVTDKLTGLFNRNKLDEAFDNEIRRTERFGHPFAVVLLDVDHFKAVNDTHGHPVGDRILVEIAALLRAHTRETDIVGRWGGEEFLILCPNTDALGAMLQAEGLRHLIQDHVFPEVEHITASFGITGYQTGDDAKHMMARADRALYAAKHQGRNRVAADQTPL